MRSLASFSATKATTAITSVTISKARDRAGDPAAVESNNAPQIRPRGLQAAQSNRAMRQPPQAIPPLRHPLRKNRQSLSFDALPCCHKTLDRNCQHDLIDPLPLARARQTMAGA